MVALPAIYRMVLALGVVRAVGLVMRMRRMTMRCKRSLGMQVDAEVALPLRFSPRQSSFHGCCVGVAEAAHQSLQARRVIRDG